MELTDILGALADGEFHSGEELGAKLGVSRTAIWKQLQKLDEIGLRVDSVKGKGYRLPGGYAPLDAREIQKVLSGKSAGLLAELIVEQQITSTSSYLSDLARVSPRSGVVCVAEQQTAGRGRLGRTWVSPYGRNLMFSVLWEFDGGAAALEGLSLAVGVAVAQALSGVGLDDIALKWPNDILHGGSKLAGILLEMQGDAAGRCQVIIGIGLNVNLPDDAPIDQTWTDLTRAVCPELDRNKLLGAILDRLLPLLQTFSSSGFVAFQEDWESFDAFNGAPATVRRGDVATEGICRGVASNGALQFETANGLEYISGGEVSLRPLVDGR